MTDGIVIGDADVDDAATFAALHALSFVDNWGEASIATLLARPQIAGWKVLVNGTRIGGFILTQVIAGEAEILTICVDPALRRLGLGRRLLETACERLRGMDASCLFLEVSEGNVGARALYERSGFAQIGRRKAYYNDIAAATGAQDALVMRKALVA